MKKTHCSCGKPRYALKSGALCYKCYECMRARQKITDAARGPRQDGLDGYGEHDFQAKKAMPSREVSCPRPGCNWKGKLIELCRNPHPHRRKI